MGRKRRSFTAGFKLEGAACECYGIVRRHFDRLLS
jgi:hypothetical protein